MIKSLNKFLAFALIGVSLPAKAHIYVIDINDTITLRNDVDPQKTPEVVNYQLVAQNIFVAEDGQSLESYIKKTIPDKTKQRETYGALPSYAKGLWENGIITEASYNMIDVLRQKYDLAREHAIKEYSDFFPSLFHLTDYIKTEDPNAKIIFQSFGKELPHALKFMKEHFPMLKVDEEIGTFNEEGELEYKGQVFKTPDQLLESLTHATVFGWNTNYKAWQQGKMGKPLIFKDTSSGSLKTYFFDDNADICGTVFYNGERLNTEEGQRFAEPYMFKVDTAQALVDTEYFTNILKTRVTAVEPKHEWSNIEIL